jgi:hypothetical protein
LNKLIIVKAISAAKNQFHSVVRFGSSNSRLRSVCFAGLVSALGDIWGLFFGIRFASAEVSAKPGGGLASYARIQI